MGAIDIKGEDLFAIAGAGSPEIAQTSQKGVDAARRAATIALKKLSNPETLTGVAIILRVGTKARLEEIHEAVVVVGDSIAKGATVLSGVSIRDDDSDEVSLIVICSNAKPASYC